MSRNSQSQNREVTMLKLFFRSPPLTPPWRELFPVGCVFIARDKGESFAGFLAVSSGVIERSVTVVR